jgi:G3E family GTPase
VLSATVPTYLVCGFLGAGKTTFILEQVKKVGSRTAVLVNEFGSLGIDGKVISTLGDVDVIEMPGGCICCSQKEGLAARIRDVVDRLHPELLLIEPSGVAEASELITALQQSLNGVISLDAVITIVDAATFLDYSAPDAFGTFFLDQIENADLLIINKRDAVGLAILQDIEEKVRRMNPEAAIVTAAYCCIDAVTSTGRVKETVVSHTTDIEFKSMTVTPESNFTREGLDHFLAEMRAGEFGGVLRAKGFLQVANDGCYLLQFTPHEASLKRFRHNAPSRLVLIGVDINYTAIDHYFKETGR